MVITFLYSATNGLPVAIQPREPSLYNSFLRVCNLLRSDMKVWNATLVHNLLDANSAREVLQTPLFNIVATDNLIWSAEKKDRNLLC